LFLVRTPNLALLDVGQGDSIWLRTPESAVLVDFGPPARTARSARALEALAIGPLENLLLTHPDLDHRGGLDSLLARHPVHGALWLRVEALEFAATEKVLESLERAQVPIRFLERASPPGLECRFRTANKSNDLSPLCWAKLRGGSSILLTGDLSGARELALVATLPQAKYLKVGHHGSRYSSDFDFLSATGARVALISVGRRNRYGHPAAETLSRISNSGMEIRRTDREGTLVLE
jgi:competence protein ComEC